MGGGLTRTLAFLALAGVILAASCQAITGTAADAREPAAGVGEAGR